MPSVKKGESQKDFVGRCVPTVLKEGTTKDQKQAVAICYSMYREHQKKMRKTKGEQIVEALGKWLNRDGKKPPTA